MRILLLWLLSLQTLTGSFASAQPEPKTASAAVISLEKQFENLDPKEGGSDSYLYFSKVSKLWADIANQLKQDIRNPPKTSDEMTEDESGQLIEAWQIQVTDDFTLLKKVSGARAKAFKKSIDEGTFQWFDHSLEYILLEVTIIPFKFWAYFYEKLYWVTDNLNKGFWGFLLIIWQILLLGLIFVVPYFFLLFSKKLDGIIEKQRRHSFYLSFRSKWHRFLTNTLSTVSPFVPWLTALVALNVVERLLFMSSFPELTTVVPYAYFYIFYKLFRVILEITLQEVINFIPLENRQGINLKIKKTSQILGLFIFVIYSVKEAFSSILGDSLIFALIEPLFGWMILALLFYVSNRWRGEVQAYLKASNLVYLNKVSHLIDGPIGFFLTLPTLAIILVHFIGVNLVDWTSQFEVTKLIYAKLLRVKFETSRSAEDGNLLGESEYKKLFKERLQSLKSESIFETTFFKTIDDQLNAWFTDKTNEQTVAVYGGKGSGCSSFLLNYHDLIKEKGTSTIHVQVPAKTFTEKSYESLFEEIFAISEDSKTVVFIDCAHNLFLSTIGGFEIYKQFQQMIEEKKNIFWVVGFDDYSWSFLNSVLGKNQYFRIHERVPKWSVDAIRDLILGVHQETGYKLEYDQIFRSSQKLQEEMTSAENRYFYLLWEKCGGAPGLAITYWFRSLRERGSKRLKVCLPSDNPVGELSLLHQEMHFVYAALFKHENLNISEATRATHLPRSVVKQAVFRGVEEGFLVVEDGRYQVSMDWIDDLKKFLKGKNLVYE